MSTIYPLGTFVMVGLPDEPMPALVAQDVSAAHIKLTGSSIGSKREALEMMDLAVQHYISPGFK